MEIHILPTKSELGQAAAAQGAASIRRAIVERGEALIIVATGASQFEMLEHLVVAPDLDWTCVTAWHLDEYAAMSAEHPASFRRYLQERFLQKLPAPPRKFHCINGEGDAQAECARLGALISAQTIDVCLAGIGENGHLAFNDPPADFQTEEPFLVVDLDEGCRRQQMGEGWFATLEDVPKQAISMSIRQIMKAREIICSVPDERKAQAVKSCVEGPVSPLAPASILQEHPHTTIFLDAGSSSLLSPSR